MHEERSRTLSRRAALSTFGSTGLLLLAGCSGSGGDSTSGPYGGWLSDANSFDSVVDATGRSEVRVSVGADNGLAFDPVAVKVSPGTTVVWEWTGNGGTHNVSHEGGDFESDLSATKGHTFSHTFERTGVYKYVCEPHRTMGMKGVVEVVEQ